MEGPSPTELRKEFAPDGYMLYRADGPDGPGWYESIDDFQYWGDWAITAAMGVGGVALLMSRNKSGLHLVFGVFGLLYAASTGGSYLEHAVVDGERWSMLMNGIAH